MQEKSLSRAGMRILIRIYSDTPRLRVPRANRLHTQEVMPGEQAAAEDENAASLLLHPTRDRLGTVAEPWATLTSRGA